MTSSISRSPGDLSSWLTASIAGKEQITTTVYDLAYAGFTGITPEPIVQRNLRNRVSYVSITHGANAAQYNQASFYTYDALGNVDTLLQDYGASDVVATQNVMNVNSNRFKRIVYQFDLISGKVNSVAYQPNQADQFYHRYTYDAENRIILAETSDDSIHWEKDARYQYYKHGPLARAVLGDQQVQGLDYAYTIQGWLKGVNSSSLEIGYDMGRDGDTTWINRYVARDAFGFNLGYYTGDYTPISSTVTPFPGYSAYLGAAYKPLFNGNISSMVVNIGKFNNPMLYAYTYDQLNRLTGMDAHTGFNQSSNSWSTLTPTNDYNERVEYDPNGNITKYQRNGISSVNLAMDNLTYNYNKDGNGRLINNRLNHVQDAVSSSNYTTDIDNQSADNYEYDEIGNLTKDNAESITNISWNVYGKIQEIQRNATDSNPTINIKYTYDAAGNRISKQVTNNSGNITYTWYSRDAQGNVMGTYKSSGTGSALSSYTVDLSEQHLYGSSRLGILNRSVNMKAAYTQGDIVSFYRGYKQYELSNHLGNVLVTITDKKKGVSTNGTTIDNYTVDVSSANDYYPFGMSMSNRNFSTSKYRYGFNGKENDKEFGEGMQDYGMRISDNRLGRFLSTDPLMKSYPMLTSYQFAGNNPIKFIDLDGLEPAEPGKKQGQSEVAAKKGTEDYFNWIWKINKKTNEGSWFQGSSTMYQNGDVENSASHDDNTKTYHPEVKVGTISSPSLGLVAPTNLDNDLTTRYNGFANAFTAGTKLESSGAKAEAQILLDNFVKGLGTRLSYRPTSNMAKILGKDPEFVKLAEAFEQQALAYFNSKGTLEGFDGKKVLTSLGRPYIKDTWYMHTVLGGTQQWNAQITQISANQIKVRYMVWDHFGAGTDDAKATLPGLSSLYWLQHNSTHYNPSTSKNYAPFNWNIRVNR